MEKECSYFNFKRYMKTNNVASKNPAVSALQDLLFYQITGIAFFAKNIATYQKYDRETNNSITRLIYLSNKSINFSIDTMISAVYEAYYLKNRIENLYKFLSKSSVKKIVKIPLAAKLQPGENLAQMVSQANIINIQKTIKSANLNINSIKEIIRISISSTANYLEHIKNDEKIPQNIYYSLYNILNFLGNDKNNNSLLKNYALKAGELHTQILEIFLSSYEKKYGLIERRKVVNSLSKGSAILVAGEDFPFLIKLLKATENKDINIYTYGILDYAHVFPEINKFKHLKGIYTGDYNNFSADIESFPGIVVLTSGNIEELREIYRGRIFTTEDISMLGVSKIDKNDLRPLINAAYDAPGFIANKENCYIEMGFGIKELENASNTLYKLLKNNNINSIKFFIGCDDIKMANKEIMYQNKSVKNAVILLNCLFTEKNLKTKNVPYVLNLGKHVNFYAIIRLLYSLSGKFRKDINDMPLDISMYIKSSDDVASLLMFLSLEIKNIKINSELPHYLTENLIKTFNNELNLQKIIENAENTNLKSNEA